MYVKLQKEDINWKLVKSRRDFNFDIDHLLKAFVSSPPPLSYLYQKDYQFELRMIFVRHGRSIRHIHSAGFDHLRFVVSQGKKKDILKKIL